MSKIIAVHGSPASGKTTFAVALATQLAQKKKHVLVLSTSRTVPMLKVLLPSENIQKKDSVGGLFISTHLVQEEVCKRILFHPQLDQLGFMGFATGDTPNTYSGIFTADKMQSFFSILLSLTDYLIVDCSHTFSSTADPLGSVALANASFSFQLLTPNIIGLEYYTANQPLIHEILINKEHYMLLGRCKPTSPIKEMNEMLEGKITYHLTESAEVADFSLSGQSFLKLKSREGKQFTDNIKTITQEVLEEK